MNPARQWMWSMVFLLHACVATAQPSNNLPILQRRWIETRTAHFHVYGCAAPQQAYALVIQLEQFRAVYMALAGTNAVESPPIVVLTFADHEQLKPFLPLYQGRPGNFAGFFKRGSDENLILLSVPSPNAARARLEIIFHEYAHLLFRRNARIWPLWLDEGMADIYSTFEAYGRDAYIALPIAPYIRLLSEQPLMPLSRLFAVTHDSPQYNESDRQGIFYAQSWLLTHFLVAGDVPVYRAGLARYTTLLRSGLAPVDAFTNAMHTSLSIMDAQLQRYWQRGQFDPIRLALPAGVAAMPPMTARVVPPVETCFVLGDVLLRVDRPDDAEMYFDEASRLAPASPLAAAGQGFLAARQGRHAEAVHYFTEALRRGSTNFLVHYACAQEQFRLAGGSRGEYRALPPEPADAIRTELRTAIGLMPHFGPAHELLGFLEMVQGDNPATAEQELQLAIQLEPDNPSYLLSLAQAQLRNGQPVAARHTLSPLLMPHTEARLRGYAEELLRKIDGSP